MLIFDNYEQKRLKKIAELAEGNTLDIGYAHIPNKYLNSESTVGLDLLSPVTECHYKERIVGDATSLKAVLGARKFQTIIAAELIEHLENPYDFLRQVNECLEVGGNVILSTPNPLSFPVIIAEYLQLKRFFYTKEHLYYFCPRWVARMLENTGFNNIRLFGVGLWAPGVVIPCPRMISYQIIYVAEKSKGNRLQ